MSNENNTLELGFDLDALLNNKSGRRTKTEYLKDGTAFYRILPSFDPVDRRINFEYYMHWLTGENGQKMKVQCTKGTEGYCPLCEASKAQEDLAKHAEASGADKARVAMLNDAAKALRSSKSIYFNAVNAANEVVVLEVNSTVFKQLGVKINEAKEKGFDATHPKTGVWFAFKKSGKGRDAYSVDFKKTTVMVEGEALEKNDRTPINDDLASRLPTAVSNLKDPEGLYIQKFTSKELADFLRGVPLKNKFQKRTQASTSENTEANTEMTTNPSAVNGTSVPTGAGTTNAQADTAAEVARLRNLSQGNVSQAK